MILSKFFEALLWGVVAGSMAAVYHSILRYEWPLQKLAPWFAQHEGKTWAKPLWFCGVCIAGQLALWGYLGFFLVPPAVHVLQIPGELRARPCHYTAQAVSALVRLIYAICTAVFTAKTLINFISKLK